MSLKDWIITIFILIPLGLFSLLFLIAVMPAWLFSFLVNTIGALMVGFIVTGYAIYAYEGFDRGRRRMSIRQYEAYKRTKRG